MLSHAGVGHNAHGSHSHGGPHNHHHQHPSHISSYHLNMNNANIMSSSEGGGMFNEREVHSMLESAVKGKDKIWFST